MEAVHVLKIGASCIIAFLQEPCAEECDFKPRTVRRDASLADNKLLPPNFNERVGDLILT